MENVLTDEKGVHSQSNDGNQQHSAAKVVDHLDSVDEDRTDSSGIEEVVNTVLDDAFIDTTMQFLQTMLNICISHEWAEQSFSKNIQDLFCSIFRIKEETDHEKALFHCFEQLKKLQSTKDEGEQEKLVAALKNNLKGLEQLDENKITSALYSQETE